MTSDQQAEAFTASCGRLHAAITANTSPLHQAVNQRIFSLALADVRLLFEDLTAKIDALDETLTDGDSDDAVDEVIEHLFDGAVELAAARFQKAERALATAKGLLTPAAKK